MARPKDPDSEDMMLTLHALVAAAKAEFVKLDNGSDENLIDSEVAFERAVAVVTKNLEPVPCETRARIRTILNNTIRNCPPTAPRREQSVGGVKVPHATRAVPPAHDRAAQAMRLLFGTTFKGSSVQTMLKRFSPHPYRDALMPKNGVDVWAYLCVLAVMES